MMSFRNPFTKQDMIERHVSDAPVQNLRRGESENDLAYRNSPKNSQLQLKNNSFGRKANSGRSPDPPQKDDDQGGGLRRQGSNSAGFSSRFLFGGEKDGGGGVRRGLKSMASGNKLVTNAAKLAEKQRERRKRHEAEVKRQEAEKNKKQLEYQAMIGKYKLRSVSISVNEEDAGNLEEKLKAEALNQKIRNRMLVMHDNQYLRNWELLTMFLVIEQMFYIPILLGFSPKQDSGSPEWVLQYIVDVSFIVDFFLQFNVARLDGNGQLLTDRTSIFKEYLRLWFWIDLAASIPFEWFISPDEDQKGDIATVKLLKILRLPRMLRLLKIMRIMKTLKISPELQRFLKYSRHAHLIKLFQIIVYVFVFIHLFSCWWYLVSAPDFPDGSPARGWFQYECENVQCYAHNFDEECLAICADLDNVMDSWVKYSTSFFAIVAMLTAGENLSPITLYEKWFASIVTLFGSILMAYIFGEIAVLISNFYARSSRYQAKMEYLFETMNRMGLPAEIEKRVYSYYEYIHEAHGTTDGRTTAFVPELSKKLAAEVLMYMRMEMIHRVPFFDRISPEVVQQLVLKLHLSVFLPKEYVVVRNEVGDEMYFIQNGTCEVTIPFKDMPKEKQDAIKQERLKNALLQEKKSRGMATQTFGVIRKGSTSISNAVIGQKKNSQSTDGILAGAGGIKETVDSEGSSEEEGSRKSSLMDVLRRKGSRAEDRKGKNFTLPPIDENKEQVLATLKKGSYFGEIALILLTKRTANVRAKGFCELCVLNREVYNKVAALYIDDKKQMEDHIMAKYGKTQNVTEMTSGKSNEVDMREGGEEEETEAELENSLRGTDESSVETGGSGSKNRAKNAEVMRILQEQSLIMTDYIQSGISGVASRIDTMASMQRNTEAKLNEMEATIDSLKKGKVEDLKVIEELKNILEKGSKNESASVAAEETGSNVDESVNSNASELPGADELPGSISYDD